MNIDQSKRAVNRRWNGQSRPSLQALKELNGQACTSCGARHYYLVLRVNARGSSATLAARCSHCHEGNWCLSEDRLARDIEQTRGTSPRRHVGERLQ